MANDLNAAELTMAAGDLYREEIFTDRRVGTIRVLTPVTADGAVDPRRPVLYQGEAQMLTAAGILPLTFDLEATSLAEAVENFAAGAKAALESAVRELQELRREAASSIIVPDRVPPPPGGLPGGLGRPRPGGRIQLP
jgi:hypothetical protein